MTFISVVTPVYRAEACLEELHRRLTASLQALTADYEIIYVDDGSPDRSGEIVAGIALRDPRVVTVRLSRNFGQHPAITAGLEEARGDWVVVMDCDLQDRPEDISLLLAKAQEGWDIVLARRLVRKDSFVKRVTSRLWFAIFNRLADIVLDPNTGSFSIISRPVVDAFLAIRDKHRHYLLLLGWLGFQRTYADVERSERYAGRSTYNVSRLITHAVSGIASQSTRLLILSIYIGFFFVALSVVQFVYVIVMKLTHGVGVAGWASTMAVLWLIGGAILFSLGILGVYIGRIFEQVQERPLFVIRQRIRGGQPD